MLKLCAFADEAGAPLADQIAALHRNGISLLELRSVDGRSVLDFTAEEARAYAAELAAGGITVYSIGSPLGKADIACDFDDYMKKVAHILDLCAVFSCRRVRVFSFFRAQDSEDEVVRRLTAMVAAAAERGVTLYHENEKEIFGDTVERVKTLMNRVPGLQFVYDPANFLQCGQDPAAAMDALFDRIGYFHIKDVITATGELVPAGEGDGHLSALIARIPRDAVLTVEPHLAVFPGYGDIDHTAMKGRHVYGSNASAFDAAVAALRGLLAGAGYTEEADGAFRRKMIRYGIIGVGNMGSAHLANFEKGLVPDACVAAVADLDEGKRARVAALYPDAGITVYDEGHKLIAAGGVDAVIVAIPHYFHPDMAMDAMRKGLAVVCEKPAGVYTKQVKEMNRVAGETGVPFTMMFNQRTNCVYRKMRELVASGAIGTVKRVNWIITNWYRSQSYYDSGSWRATWRGEGGGVLLNQCPHQLDLLQWVVGMMPARMQAHCHFGKWHDIEVEDDVTAYFEYENGATGVFVTSTADAPGTNRFEILGTGGKLVCEKGATLHYYRNEVDEREFNRTWQGGFGEPKWVEVPVETDGQNPQHVGILRNFTDALLGRAELFVRGEEGLRGVTIMDAMLLSAFLGGKMIDIPFDDDLYYAELQKRVASGRRKEGADRVLDTSATYGGMGK